MNVGKRIKQAREQLGLSVDALAAALDIDRSTIYRYESNYIEKLPTKILVPLAKILKTTPVFLMGWEDESSTIEKEQPTSELPLTDDHKRILESVTDLAQEDLEKVIDYALLLKKARNS